MTMTPSRTRSREEYDEWLAMCRGFLATSAPLPTAEELAAPIVAGLEALQQAFDGWAETLEADLCDVGSPGKHRADAVRLVEIAEGVAMILRREIRANLCGEFKSLTLNMDDVVRAITQSPQVESALYLSLDA